MDTLCVACAALTAALAGIVCAETPTAAKCFQSLNKAIIFGDSGYKVHKFRFHSRMYDYFVHTSSDK